MRHADLGHFNIGTSYWAVVVMTICIFGALTGCGRELSERMVNDFISSEQFRRALVTLAEQDAFGHLAEDALIVVIDDTDPNAQTAYRLCGRAERHQFLLDRSSEHAWALQEAHWSQHAIRGQDIESIMHTVGTMSPKPALVISFNELRERLGNESSDP